ncbi:short-subunit dehydrogenase [Rhizobium sp. SG_E_25_P2]|uniref:SDR family NAD(P)-dependent oxidoreductase n=1 Tax=Rhizobium sp. SG_E_25_P2 TaxID=2879942 RepID=UPI002474FAEB|nr:SDR family NAD(P)-dependent oxidoreductase [Rhizobium sp. SG_E_25_P2]MDH6264635.1 short-subunit dehydrogenase [Rhizobium sp. SG_E_25_P2]
MAMSIGKLAVVTGASTGIGFELARVAAREGYELLIAADEEAVHTAAEQLRAEGATVTSIVVDLATSVGVTQLVDKITANRAAPEILMANAGRGLGHAFLDQDIVDIRHVVDTNVTGTLALIHAVGGMMRIQRRGRILITGSIAGFMPGSFQAVYNASKAFLNSFSFALRDELKDSGVTITCLMPGPTETRFFDRAGLLDTSVGQAEKDDPVDVARIGFRAMLDGEGDVVSGVKNKLQAAIANVTPSGVLASAHRKMAEPGSAK